MIPGPNESLSFLMGAEAITDDELGRLGVTVVGGSGTPYRRLVVPADRRDAYTALVRAKLTPGFWNEIVGRDRIDFVFRLADGTVRELELSASTRAEIAERCSAMNGDPIEKTSDVARYLGGNPFYRDAIAAFHGAKEGP